MEGRSTTLTVQGRRENLSYVNEAVQALAIELKFNQKFRRYLAIICDEIFSNIVKYAYPEGQGCITVSVSESDKVGELILCFSDEGKPFNPLSAHDPETSLPPDQRPVGGMGIYIVKQLAKSISYAHENGRNVLNMVLAEAK